jgi:hypothetical protein
MAAAEEEYRARERAEKCHPTEVRSHVGVSNSMCDPDMEIRQ